MDKSRCDFIGFPVALITATELSMSYMDDFLRDRVRSGKYSDKEIAEAFESLGWRAHGVKDG